MSRKVQGLAIVTPDEIRIPRKNKNRKTPDRKKPIGYTANPRKISKEGTVTDAEKCS